MGCGMVEWLDVWQCTKNVKRKRQINGDQKDSDEWKWKYTILTKKENIDWYNLRGVIYCEWEVR